MFGSVVGILGSLPNGILQVTRRDNCIDWAVHATALAAWHWLLHGCPFFANAPPCMPQARPKHIAMIGFPMPSNMILLPQTRFEKQVGAIHAATIHVAF